MGSSARAIVGLLLLFLRFIAVCLIIICMILRLKLYFNEEIRLEPVVLSFYASSLMNLESVGRPSYINQ